MYNLVVRTLRWKVCGYNPQRRFCAEPLHHRRVLCRAPHSGSWMEPLQMALDVILYVGSFVEPSGRFYQEPFSYRVKSNTVSTFISKSV